jgi:hypothetical protein
MHSREIEELVKSFSKCRWRVTNFLQVSRFLAPFFNKYFVWNNR